MPRGRRKQYSDTDSTLSRGIISIILVVSAAIVALSFFDKAGTFGVILNEWLLAMLFGSMRYALPVVIIVFAWYVIKDMDYDYRSTHGIGAFLFFIALSGLFHIGFMPDDMWTQALEGNGGGVFGMFAWVLKTYVGMIASVLILIAMTLVSILLMFNTSAANFVMLHRKLFERLGGLGRAITGTTKTLFVEDDEEGSGADEYEAEEEEEEESEEERRFSKRALEEDNDETEDLDDDEEEEEEEEEEAPAPRRVQVAKKAKDAWTQPAIIRPLPKTSLLKSKKSKPTSGDIKASAKQSKKR